MSELYSARPGPITPIAGIGQNILVYKQKKYFLYNVVYREGLPYSAPLMMNFGAIAAGATLAGQSLQNILEMPDNQIGQFRMQVLDDVQVTLWEPRSNGRFQLKNNIAQVSAYTALQDSCGHTTEFFVHEATWPFVDITNPRVAATVTARIAFYGFKYVVEQISEVDNLNDISRPYTAVVSEGY
jgi:hypothetical protein